VSKGSTTGYRISGRVTDASNPTAGVPGISVGAQPNFDCCFYFTNSDADGRYSLVVNAATYRITFFPPPGTDFLEQAWNGIKQSEGGTIVVDLTGITFIEDKGKQLLSRMWREGAELIATGCCNRPIVEQITGARPSSPAHQRRRR